MSPTSLLSHHLASYLSIHTGATSRATHDHYARSLRYFELHLGRPAVLSDLTDDAVAAWMLTMLHSGAIKPATINQRAKQVLALRREWVGVEAHTAVIPGSARKGGRKSMAYRLRAATCATLAEMMRAPTGTGLVFDCHWTAPKSIYGPYRKLIQDAGLAWHPRVCGFHRMRRTVLTMIEMRGGDACAFARHSSRAVTDAYIDRALVLAQKKSVWPPEESQTPQKKSWFGLFG